ncbi:MAG: DUF2508 family protein [Eubacteriales bacterium]
MKKNKRNKEISGAVSVMKEELAHTRIRIETVENNFENVIDHDLIDSYIFESNAAWKRYHFLLRQIRLLSSI